MGLNKRERKTFAIITADGKIRVQSVEADPGAEKREFVKSDGTTVIKFERVYDDISGKIIDISFKDTDFGKMMNIMFEKEPGEDAELVLSIGASSNFASSIMCRLPNVDLKSELVIKPYSMEMKNGKTHKGVSVQQFGNKLTNFFSAKDPNDEKKTIEVNGFPPMLPMTPKPDKDDWKIYFMQVTKFLVNYTTENILPKLELSVDEILSQTGGQEINVDTI